MRDAVGEVVGGDRATGGTAALSRRRFLEAAGIAAGAMAVPTGLWTPYAAAEPLATRGFGAGRPLRAAMHVHGSWSEQEGSWEAQLHQAATNGYDLLYLTDHDRRALAMGYATSLTGMEWDPVTSTGRLTRLAASVDRGSFHLLAESSALTLPASVTMPIYGRTRFRTSVSGLTIKHTVDSVRLGTGARYEVVLTLSHHPALAGRPAGQYELVYRFGAHPGRRTENGGFTGVVGLPRPGAGTTQTLVPVKDIAAIWPEMMAIDNSSYGLAFRARSPRRGSACDVRVRSVRFGRSRSTAAAVIADQAAMLARYRPRFPSLTVQALIETSRTLPDMNPFGIPPWIPDYSTMSQDRVTYHQQISDKVHAMGGLISYNHPFGAHLGPLLSPADQAARRRKIFRDMQAVGRFDADILEVGYNVRGNVDCPTHLALWDTFSRNGNFLTGNGVTDDHSGKGWAEKPNGFATGIWAPSTGRADVVRALAAGRVYVAHAGQWSGALDLLVDDSVPMGAVSVSDKGSRSLAVWATQLPPGGAVQVVGGPVDYAGNPDPATSVVATLSPSSFSGDTAAVTLDTSASQFFRVQVLDERGRLLGSSNPVWLLRANPPHGIPPARRVT
ncbi:twin-arginine translocation signal domain-containing protein [Nocardioides marmoribigeumensis]|uniref:Twin-arginine translocation signal domain-containing protein n=1 Tax=Nocardioides marmoribigeumensis TaxID=433649 RepID=A0ABU2BZD1_9ACTN|nr:twin-arginine translocation signal domain-containing protein [Nocardioides marmoribigeumensis]MDR7363752.1 hypothetical protein [Nocardioides marmoribigeumensis]